MKKIIIKNNLLLMLAVCMLLTTYFSSCKKVIYPIVPINTGLNITQYFETNPTQFSLFDQILEKTGYAGFLGAYGAYTVFAPNNDAINLYLKGMGKTSIADVNIDTLKQMAQYHIILDTLSTGNFKDSKLPTPTLYGQYLLTGATNVNGVSSYTINNNQALVVQTNIFLGNGIVHVIDHVLRPATLTLAQLIQNNPKYSIFSQALKATGLYDTLNVLPINATNPKRKYLTAFIVPDSAIIAAGFPDFNSLKAKYSTTGNPMNPNDSLYLYVAYHIVPENSYLTDIISTGSHHTLSPTDVISDVLLGQTILINNDTFNGVLEPGIPVDRANSNITATNGVLHAVLANYKIKVRLAQPLYWDVADIPEFRANTSTFRRPGKNFQLPYPGAESAIASGTGTNNGNIQYTCVSTTDASAYYWNDFLGLFQFRTGGAFGQVMWHTPTIVKGKYKVWICFGGNATNAGAQFFFDGGDGVEQVLQNVIPKFSTTTIPNSTDPGPVLESKGYKRYAADLPITSNKQVGYLLGVVNVITTDRHYLRMKAIGGANNDNNPLPIDMFHFIPTTQDQEQPRFKKDGTTVVLPY